MYLITLEGGDGSGKGTATKMVADILRQEGAFTSVQVTAEPRRNHPLGQLAVEAVRTGESGPFQEAGYFAADRLDHSHMWIRPRLMLGAAVVSERNVHSSLVYQGIVGDLGLEEVARLNANALVPDLTIWVDCEPEIALKRINEGTLRMATVNKTEYFETNELQARIRVGFQQLLGGEVAMPEPFNRGQVEGPIMNHKTESDLEDALRVTIRRFLRSSPPPLNVTTQEVEMSLLKQSMDAQDGQQTLDVGREPQKDHEEWLNGVPPWRVLASAHSIYSTAWEASDERLATQVPKSALSRTVFSIVGTLSLVPSADVRRLRATLGPVRSISHRHTQRMLQFLDGQQGWIRRHRSILGREAPRAELRSDWLAFGRMALILAPLRPWIDEWAKKAGERPRWRDSLSQILNEDEEDVRTAAWMAIERFQAIGTGLNSERPLPNDIDDLKRWYRGE